jgi:hypothetical protein
MDIHVTICLQNERVGNCAQRQTVVIINPDLEPQNCGTGENSDSPERKLHALRTSPHTSGTDYKTHAFTA